MWMSAIFFGKPHLNTPFKERGEHVVQLFDAVFHIGKHAEDVVEGHLPALFAYLVQMLNRFGCFDFLGASLL